MSYFMNAKRLNLETIDDLGLEVIFETPSLGNEIWRVLTVSLAEFQLFVDVSSSSQELKNDDFQDLVIISLQGCARTSPDGVISFWKKATVLNQPNQNIFTSGSDIPILAMRRPVHLSGSNTEAERPVHLQTERLEVGVSWIDFTVEGELFVIWTARGYVPALLVQHRGTAKHLLIGAKSLAEPFEAIRRKSGGLHGQALRVRKLGSEKTSLYELQEVL